jgi:nucleotide-binding universal stress UspA family protein
VIHVDKAQEVRVAPIAEDQQLVDDAASELRLGRDFTRGEVVVEDDAREAIVARARDWNAKLIVMGARGPRRVGWFFSAVSRTMSPSRGVKRCRPCPEYHHTRALSLDRGGNHGS